MFNYLSHCKVAFIHYPLRALSEFFHQEQTEQALSKLLNSDSIKEHKLTKWIQEQKYYVD